MPDDARRRKILGATLIAIALACFATAFVLLFFPADSFGRAEARSGVEAPLDVRTDFDRHFWVFVGLVGGGTISGIIGLTLVKPDV